MTRARFYGWAFQLVFTAVFGLVLCGSTAWAVGPEFVVPESIQPGQPFVVGVRSDAPIEVAKLTWRDKEVALAPTTAENGGYEALVLLGLGLAHEKDTEAPLRIEAQAGGERRVFDQKLVVKPKKYKEQHLKVAKKYTSLSQEVLDRHYAEKKLVLAALNRVSPVPVWHLPLVRPVGGGVSSPFGVRRVFNGEPRSPHKGLDLRGAAGTPIKAAAGGEVVLTGDHYFSGNVVYIDHGLGMVTMYCHLSKIMVKQGQTVDAGEVIGLVGQTGRVTGPHLHFAVSLLGNLVDPVPLLQGTFDPALAQGAQGRTNDKQGG